MYSKRGNGNRKFNGNQKSKKKVTMSLMDFNQDYFKEQKAKRKSQKENAKSQSNSLELNNEMNKGFPLPAWVVEKMTEKTAQPTVPEVKLEQEKVEQSEQKTNAEPIQEPDVSDLSITQSKNTKLIDVANHSVTKHTIETIKSRARTLGEKVDRWGPNILEVSRLGAVSTKKYLYFEQTRQVEDQANEFLLMAHKYEIFNQLSAELLEDKRLKVKNLRPSCISFITASLDKEKICFVAISKKSGEEKAENIDIKMVEYLDKTATRLNTANNGKIKNGDRYRFAVIKSSSPTFKKIIGSLVNDTRTCAEYDFGAVLAKLFEEYGDRLQIEGCVNAELINYDDAPSDIDVHRKSNSINDKYSQVTTAFINCCETCKANKSMFLGTLAAFREEGQQLNEVQQIAASSRDENKASAARSEKNLVLSPIRERNEKSSTLGGFFSRIEEANKEKNNPIPIVVKNGNGV